MIRILIVDDQNIIREGVRVLLENSTEIEIAGFAEDGETAMEKIGAIQPDVVLLDINLPGIDGLTVANRIGVNFPQIKAIMLSSCEDESYVRKAMMSSAKGYLLKNVSAEELQWAIKLVHQGYSAFKSELLDSLGKDGQNTPAPTKERVEESRVFSAERLNSNSVPLSQPSPEELELSIAKKQVRQKYSRMKNQRRNLGFHDVNISRTKKTMMSLEFRLLVSIILFALGFLVFVALS